MNPDPLTVVEDDAEDVYPDDRDWSGYALLACVAIGALVILLAGVRR